MNVSFDTVAELHNKTRKKHIRAAPAIDISHSACECTRIKGMRQRTLHALTCCLPVRSRNLPRYSLPACKQHACI